MTSEELLKMNEAERLDWANNKATIEEVDGLAKEGWCFDIHDGKVVGMSMPDPEEMEDNDAG